MTGSTLDPDKLPLGPDRVLGRGHGTGALGPSDSSDTGGDLQGAPGLAQQLETGLAAGTSADTEEGTAGGTAGPDVGDADIDVDHIETIPPDLGDVERARAGHRPGV